MSPIAAIQGVARTSAQSHNNWRWHRSDVAGGLQVIYDTQVIFNRDQLSTEINFFNQFWTLLLEKGFNMLHYAVVFLVIALIAALFGFGGIAAGAAGIAKILFVVFLICAVVAFLVGPRRV